MQIRRLELRYVLLIIPIGFIINLGVSYNVHSIYYHHRPLSWFLIACFSLLWYLGGLILTPLYAKPAFALGLSGGLGNLFFWAIHSHSVPNPLIVGYIAFNVADVLLWTSGIYQVGFLAWIGYKALKNHHNSPESASSERF
jgi:lipoprotein signal peptidase